MEEDESYLKLSVEDRCQHKLWKARVSGYEEATKLFQMEDKSSPVFNKYLGLLKKIANDSNAIAQEKGLAAILAFVENAANAPKTTGEVMSALVSKSVSSPRAKTRELALEITLMYIEIEKQDVVCEELLKGLDNKSPKVVAACIVALREALHLFGSQVIPIKIFAGKLTSLLENKDKAVRDESKQLCVEIYRWVGKVLTKQLQSLKPVTLTDLENEFEKTAGEKVAATRYLRSQQAVQKEASSLGGGENATVVEEEPPKIDEFDLMPSIDLLGLLPKDFYDQCESKKWQDRKLALENLVQLSTNVKLEPGEYGDLVRLLKKLITKDSNVLVVALAVKSLTHVVLGLRKKFHPYSSACIPAIFEKFKEKKQNVVVALRECIDALFTVSSFEAMQEDLQTAVDNKNPQIRAETCAFLSRAFATCSQAQLSKKLLKPLTAMLIKTLNDTDATVRENSAEALGTALKVVGERQMTPFLQGVDEIKMAKIKTFCESAVVVAKPASVETKPVAEKVAAPPPAARVVKPDTATFKKPGPSVASKATKAPTSGARSVRPSTAKKATESAEPEFKEPELDEEQVLEQVLEVLSQDVVNSLVSSNWKERLSAAEKFYEVLQAMDKEAIPAQAFIKLVAKKPGFKENNIQVLKLRFEILAHIANNAKISRTTIDSVLSDIVDKIGDAKSGSFAASALTALTEATSLEYMSIEVLNLAFAQRNPKNQSDAINWTSTAIKEFGFRIKMDEMIKCLKKGLSSTNPTVRTATVSLLGTMFLYVGEQLKSFFSDEKPSLLQLVDAEFDKLRDAKPPVPCRGKGAKVANASGGNETEDAAAESVGQIGLADLMPRVDISSQITQQILSDLSDKDWHLRSEALQKISTIITDAKFIQPNLGDLPTYLKPRLVDTNKKLALQALQICQLLGSSLGNNCSKQLRNFAPGILSCLGDNKANVRATAVQCLNTWIENCSLVNLFESEMICDALKTDNPFIRIELFLWLTEKMPTVTSLPSSELTICLPILLSCLEDRNPEVRKNAAECVFPFMVHTGFEPMARAASKLKPASKNTVMAQLEKVRQTLPAKPSAKSKTQTKIVEKPSSAASDDGAKGKMVRSTSKPKLALKAPNPVSKGKKEEEVDTSPPIVVNKLKQMRMLEEKALKVLKWNFTTPREEFYAQLKEQMTAADWSKTIISHAFHNDFKFHIKAIDLLNESLKNDLEASKANLDLILKWLALRFFDTNPSVIIKSLEYLQLLFHALSRDGYHMTESEAASFVPYLILKIGDPKDPIRKSVREIIKLVSEVYPYSKMFTYIMGGLGSKNGRQRAECLEELDSMIENYGISVCQPSPPVALKEIARHIADRDNSVRNAALNCCARAKIPGGEKVWDYFGPLSDKDRSLLEERIKRICKTMSVKTSDSGIPSSKHTPPTHLSSPYTSEEPAYRKASEQKVHTTPSPKAGPLKLEMDDIDRMFQNREPMRIAGLVDVNADDILNLPDIQLPKTRMRPPATSLRILNNSDDVDTAVNLVMAQLAAHDIPVVIQAFAQINEVLLIEEHAVKVFEPRVDQLLVMGAMQYRYAHNRHMSDENICKADVLELFKSVSMTLSSLFGNPVLAKKASRDVLRDLIPHLITVILDERLNELQEGASIIKSINILIMRVLQKANSTHVLSALIKLLHDCVGSVNVSDRFTELVMKCLWKMIRMFEVIIHDLNIDRVLLDIHVFLKAFPSSFWKGQQNDTPIRTIKTIMYKLVELKNEDIIKHFTLISDRNESELMNIMQKLLMKRRVDNHKSSHKHTNSDDNESGNIRHKRTKSSPLKLSKSTHEALTEIFKKIGSKEDTKEGISELYEFTQAHPEEDIEPFMKSSSDFFQNYVRQGLQKLEKEKESFNNSNQNSPFAKMDETTGAWNSNVSAKKDPTWDARLPPPPPCTVDTTPMDLVEWMKTVVARLGMDTTKYDDPAFLDKITGNGNDGPLTDEELEKMTTDVDRYRKLVDDLKQAHAL